MTNEKTYKEKNKGSGTKQRARDQVKKSLQGRSEEEGLRGRQLATQNTAFCRTKKKDKQTSYTQ